ncbi:MAG: response regulator [Clostridiales bacterium]|nr:response regulator [Clostridiales bacterium]
MYHVLIVEDDPMVASINRQYVEVTPSFRVDRIFKNGPDALDYLKKTKVDLIILDYYMPLMNGAEFVDALRRSGIFPSIIMVTSANDTDIVRSLIGRGVIDYLIKPFEYSRFRTALEKFANIRECLDQSQTNVDQTAIDRMLVGTKSSDSSTNLAKGLNKSTLKMIREFLRANPGRFFTSEEIATQICLSRITVRRYMNYLVETGELVSRVNYRTGGRPSIEYGISHTEPLL